MRFQLLEKFEGTDALAQLFNEYLHGLHTPMTFSDPTYTTMAEVSAYRDSKSKTAKHHRSCAQRYYELLILRHSLESIHSHVHKAIALLEGFYTVYEDNLLAYAIDNRQAIIEKYGSDDETDWYRHNEADESEPWKVVVKTDAESLKHYTLHEELGSFFGGESCGRGEYIGTSTAADFYPNTGTVAQQSAFSFRRMMEGVSGKEVTITRVEEDGSHTPMTLADHLEDEMNEDIRNGALVDRFNAVLTICHEIGRYYARMEPANMDGYHVLHYALKRVRDMDIPAAYLPATE